MELFFLYPLIAFLSIILISLQVLFCKQKFPANLPPGSTGWPLIGESLEFLSTGWKGHPEKFVFDRLQKYSPECFKTSILGRLMTFMNGPSGNKFLFSNENKLVNVWWPDSVNKIFPTTLELGDSKQEARKVRKLVPLFLKPDALQKYVGIMDTITRQHVATSWEGQDEILAVPLARNYTFWIACRLFLSAKGPEDIAHFADPFHLLATGIISVPIDLPGTPFNRAIKAAKVARKEVMVIIKQRRHDMAMQKAIQPQDLLSHILSVVDENGQSMSDADVADKMIGLLVGGHDTVTSALVSIVRYLAELPHIYDAVFKEQTEIAKSKGPGELLRWEDIQKMRYSWNVACEAMRLSPPVQGSFREALHDFTYAGFTIPQGWKLYWSANATHHNPEYFPDPQNFNPTRFEGNGPAPYTFVPFGGGPRMCPGKEYARLLMLVFMYNVVTKFRWEKKIPNEKVVYNPSPLPEKGLPIRLIPHQVKTK